MAAVAALGALLGVAGIAFKISLVPFHLWTPDTYAGAPLPVAAFLAVVSKTAGVAAMLVLLGVGLPSLAAVWAPVVGVLALVTMTVGNLVALRQRVAVRLLAWSTVAQAGWVMVPLAAARPARRPPAPGVAASVGYLIAYVAASLAAFAVVVLLARHHPAGEEHTLEAYRGLARREPVGAFVLGFALACLAGLPPGVMGLVAKVVAVRPLVDARPGPFAVVARERGARPGLLRPLGRAAGDAPGDRAADLAGHDGRGTGARRCRRGLRGAVGGRPGDRRRRPRCRALASCGLTSELTWNDIGRASASRRHSECSPCRSRWER